MGARELTEIIHLNDPGEGPVCSNCGASRSSAHLCWIARILNRCWLTVRDVESHHHAEAIFVDRNAILQDIKAEHDLNYVMQVCI
jgi:hypothetical protein